MGKTSARVFGRILFLFAAIGLSACAGSPTKKNVSPEEKARLQLEVAAAAFADGDLTSALQSALNAETLYPKLPEIYHAKALIFAARKELPQAMKELRRALELNPEYPEANNTCGKLLLDAGKYAEAEKYLKKAADNPLYRDAYKAQTALGILYYRKANFTRAQKQLDRAIAAAPQFACIAYYYRGHLAIRESRFKEAVRDYDQATRKFCASFGDAHLALGIAYVQSHQYELARKKFVEVQERFPNSELSERALGQLRYLP